MNNLRSYEQIIREEQLQSIYAIAANPQWEHYDPANCPLPVREWISKNYPDVALEQIRGFECQYDLEFINTEADIARAGELPPPIFRLGFTDAQAEHFVQEWSAPPLQPLDGADNFYFISY